MARYILLIFLYILLYTRGFGQVSSCSGKVINAQSGAPLQGASVIVYKNGKISTGTFTNNDGEFNVFFPDGADSLRFSMVGYISKTVNRVEKQISVSLSVFSLELNEVVVKPLSAIEIVQLAIRQLPSTQPSHDFETHGFYREIIKDRENYFSVAEAIFSVQFFPRKGDYKLKLDKGRAKEDVAFTRLFEDFHPGGGPQRSIQNSFILQLPAFLELNQLKKFDLKRLPSTVFGGRQIYVIAFDQKPGVKESLEKGKLFIDAIDFSVVKYEAENCPAGTPFIKHLTGSDKIFAQLLNIDFKRKGWKRTVDFTKLQDKWVLNHTIMEHSISYKQSKKKLDLDLTITSELLIAPVQDTIIYNISGREEWQRNNLVKNLPFTFDSSYWGNSSVIVPTAELTSIIKSIADRNGEDPAISNVAGWKKFNENAFVSSASDSTIIFVPIQKSKWDNDNTGPLLYRELDNDFSIECMLLVSKSKMNEPPDKGFQQCGLIIRQPGIKENNVSVALGTHGSKSTGLILTHTINGKSKQSLEKSFPASCYIKMEKKKTTVSVYIKINKDDTWDMIHQYKINWPGSNCQAGLFGSASFPGNGPKMYPDIKGVFSQLKITEL